MPGPNSSNPPERPLHVLIAEDKEVNQFVISNFLDLIGHNYEIAANGAEACSSFQSGRFDLVLLDIRMPVMDGVEALHAINDVQCVDGRIPVVAVTAHASAEDREHLLSEGFDAVVCKPFQLDELSSLIDRVRNKQIDGFSATA